MYVSYVCNLHNSDWDFQHRFTRINKYFHTITCSIPLRMGKNHTFWRRVAKTMFRQTNPRQHLSSYIEIHSWTRNAAEKFMPHMMQNWRGLYLYELLVSGEKKNNDYFCHLTLSAWPCDLDINKSHLSRGNYHIIFW